MARALTGIGLAPVGRAGSRLTVLLDILTRRSSLLRLIMALPDPQAGPVRILGVDLAFRRGRD